jgi:hypothetical protein
MRRQPIESSRLPTLMLPCPRCGHRFVAVSVAPTRVGDDLDDVTEECLRCGNELVRTVRSVVNSH